MCQISHRIPLAWLPGWVIPMPACGLLQAAAPPSSPPTDAGAKARLVESYGKLPLNFEANEGQTDGQVRFLSREPGYSLYLTPTEAVLSLPAPSSSPPGSKRSKVIIPSPLKGEGQDGGRDSGRGGTPELSTPTSILPPPGGGNQEAAHSPAKASTLRLQLLGANPNPKISGVDELPGKDLKRWRTDIPTYAKVRYEKVYPGIGFVYYGNPQQLEPDFVAAPGANPGKIRLAFAGAEKLAIDGKPA